MERKKVLLLFTSFALCRWHIKYILLHILLQVTQTKSDKYIVGKSLIDVDIIETKDEKENTSKESVCTICGISFTSIAQSVTFSSMLTNHFFVKHKLKLIKCENCENLFKTKDNFARHGTMIHNKCHISGKIFKNINTITKHFVK